MQALFASYGDSDDSSEDVEQKSTLPNETKTLPKLPTDGIQKEDGKPQKAVKMVLPSADDMLEGHVEPDFLKKAPTEDASADFLRPSVTQKREERDGSGNPDAPPPKRVMTAAPPPPKDRKAEDNKKKNAGKKKGEFKKRSEGARGGEQKRDRWD